MSDEPRAESPEITEHARMPREGTRELIARVEAELKCLLLNYLQDIVLPPPTPLIPLNAIFFWTPNVENYDVPEPTSTLLASNATRWDFSFGPMFIRMFVKAYKRPTPMLTTYELHAYAICCDDQNRRYVVPGDPGRSIVTPEVAVRWCCTSLPDAIMFNDMTWDKAKEMLRYASKMMYNRFGERRTVDDEAAMWDANHDRIFENASRAGTRRLNFAPGNGQICDEDVFAAFREQHV